MAAPQYLGQLDAPRKVKSPDRERNRLATNNESQKTKESAEVAPEITNSFEVREEITNFSNDQSAIVEPQPGEVPMPLAGADQFTDARFHDVISYLQRPTLKTKITWDPALKRSEKLFGSTFSVPNDFFHPQYRAKLDGFTSFKATLVLTLQVNAHPFQAGRLLLYAVPMPTLTAPRSQWVGKHVSMAQALHNVQMDIAQQTEVTLRIPFISPFNSFDLIHGYYPWAEFNVMVYSPLNQVAVVDVECLLWAHFEDIELGAPTSAPMFTATQQSGKVSTLPAAIPKNKGAPNKMSPAAVDSTRKIEQGAIGKVSAGAAKGWNILGNTIPFVKPVTDIFGGLASAAGSFLDPIFNGFGKLFGFSKPVSIVAGTTVFNRPTECFPNVEGSDSSCVLALSPMNAIDEYPDLGGTTLSETSLDFLKTIPQYFYSFKYGTSTIYGTQLMKVYVTPTYNVPAQVTFTPPTSGNFAVPAPFEQSQPLVLNYISSSFVYWTGSLVYTFRFVKTRFHSGRVEITYHPFTAVTPNPDNRYDYVYRLVVDLRDNSEVSVAIPYISATPWKTINYTYDPLKEQSWDTIKASATGYLMVRNLTPLICASEIIGSEIECVVEVRAGNDYSLQCPIRSEYIPFRFLSTLNNYKAKQQAGAVYALPGTFETRTTAIMGKEAPSISGQEKDVNRQSTEMFCAGERFENFQALTRRFNFVEFVKRQPDSVLIRQIVDYVKPPSLDAVQYLISKGDQQKYGIFFQLKRFPSPLSMIAGMYAFFRGSLRIKIYVPGAPDLMSMQLVYRPDYGYSTDSVISIYNYLGPAAFEQPTDKKFAEFQIPYYSPTVITVPYPEESPGKLFTQPLVSFIFSSTATTEEDVYIASAAGDDMTFHSFVGIPPCLYISQLGKTYKSNVGTAQDVDVPYFDLYNMSANPTQNLLIPGAPDLSEYAEEPNYFQMSNVTFNDIDFNPPPGSSVVRHANKKTACY